MIFIFDELADNPPALFAYLAAFLVAIYTAVAFHEFCHAWSAYELGDDTAQKQGRLTLNPFAHLEPMWVVIMVLIGFGMGKPTPVNPYNLRPGVKLGSAIVSLAGPASNLVFATIAALPIRLGWIDSIASFNEISDASGEEIAGLFLIFIVYFNVLLFIFNLLPIPMLDGYKIVWGLAPDALSIQLRNLEARVGFMPLMVLFLLSFVGLSPITWIIRAVQDDVFNLVL